MLVTHEREKLINAIIFFATNTKYLGKIKLFKLLYFLDFEHYKEAGRSVTGLDYCAWKMGPVPVSLFEEVEKPEPDMAQKVEFSEKQTRQGAMLTINPISKFEDTHFSKREMRIMHKLAQDYFDCKAEDMIEATHLENQPWHKIYVERGKKQEKIPYALALRKQELETMLEVITDRSQLLEHFRGK